MQTEKYRKAADAGDNEFSNFVNYGVKKKPEGKYKLHRILMVCGYILFCIIYLIVFLVPVKLAMMITFLPVLTWILVYFTWYWVNIYYEYMIIGGSLRLLEIFGMRRMRVMCEFKISSLTIAAPYTGAYRKEADSAEITRRIYGVSSMKNPDVYFGIYTDSDGKLTAVFFEATEKTLKAMRYYNPNVVMSKTRL